MLLGETCFLRTVFNALINVVCRAFHLLALTLIIINEQVRHTQIPPCYFELLLMSKRILVSFVMLWLEIFYGTFKFERVVQLTTSLLYLRRFVASKFSFTSKLLNVLQENTPVNTERPQLLRPSSRVPVTGEWPSVSCICSYFYLLIKLCVVFIYRFTPVSWTWYFFSITVVPILYYLTISFDVG